ncbi:uncharacterized protein LOC133182650 [Saccostrea echinata]|uniref:uncharacterized protein LOC133182650 n=1 Tax=Saccostrea echinata TaxID=191078 RepID=UPI002A804C32|nr:uncharacterized protein LOC133182650 [Saccostrea echinata]
MYVSTLEEKLQSHTENTALWLAEIYTSTETWTFRRQILSILAQDYNFDVISQLIPGLTSWRYYAAKKHSNEQGCGVPVLTNKIQRNKVNMEQLEYFLDFITSSNILKDITFGEKNLKLSNGEVIHIPNVVRCMGPSSLIGQYQHLCESEEFHPLGMNYFDKISQLYLKGKFFMLP